MKRKLILVALECIVVFVLVPLLALYKARHDSGRTRLYMAESMCAPLPQHHVRRNLPKQADRERKVGKLGRHELTNKSEDDDEFGPIEPIDDGFGEVVPISAEEAPQVKVDLSKYTDEELMRMRDELEDEPQGLAPQAAPEDPDADLKRKFSYVAERGDREDERRMAQNAVNWLASNKSATLSDGGEKLRGYAEQMFTGTKERTNDWTYEERLRRYNDRYRQALCLSNMSQFIVDENGKDERYAGDTRKAQNVLNFLTNHTSKFDVLGDADVAELTQGVKEMYDAAAGRRGFFRKTLDSLFSWADGFFKAE